MALRKYTKEWLEELCEDSYSYNEVLQKAGRQIAGGNHSTLKKKVEEFDVDVSHFTGQLWSKGKTKKDDLRITTRENYRIEDIFIQNSPVPRKLIRAYVLRHDLIKYGCSFCGNDGHWLEQEIALDLDHINGVNNDHCLENLRWLCPNCHATTDTYRGKNKK